jgi:hypothetical protein
MPTSQTGLTPGEIITPSSSFAGHPLTPPPTDEKPFAQAQRVIALFEAIRAGKHIKRHPWTEFQLAPGDYDEIERQLSRDEVLSGYVVSALQTQWAWRLTTGFVRYDYNGETHHLVVRMSTGVHELFIDGVEDAIRSQLKAIRSGSGNAARFAQKVRPARSTGIEFPVENALLGRKSKYEPDASFWHDDAQYPRVIIKVAYSQEKKRLGRLAEDYLLDSDANIRIVVGLDVKYGKKGSRKATLSVWRTDLFHTPNGDELRVVQEVADEVYYIVHSYVLYQHLHFAIPYSPSSLGV